MIVNYSYTGFIHARIVSCQGKLCPFCGLNWLPNSAQLLGQHFCPFGNALLLCLYTLLPKLSILRIFKVSSTYGKFWFLPSTMEELYSSRFHETLRNTIPPGFMNQGGIIFFNEPQLFVFLKDHRNFEISIQTLFSFNKKSFSLQAVTHPSSD